MNLLPGTALVGSSIPEAGWGILVQNPDSQGGAPFNPARATDAELIKASWEQPEYFEEVFSRHYRVIYRHVVRRVGPDVASDVASEVFERAFASRRKFKVEYASARPWLFGIAANLLRQHYRSHKRATRAHWKAMAREPWKTADGTPEADRRVDAAALSPALEQGLSRLRRAERDVLLLYAWSDLSYPEIAAALDIPVGTVRSRLSRARARFRELMGAEWQISDEESERDD